MAGPAANRSSYFAATTLERDVFYLLWSAPLASARSTDRWIEQPPAAMGRLGGPAGLAGSGRRPGARSAGRPASLA